MLWDDHSGLELLAGAEDADELCRRLLASSSGRGSSTRHMEAVELLGEVHGTGELPVSFVALLLCTCPRWDRVTAKLIAAIEASGLLAASELDELAESLLTYELIISYPLAWVSPEWLDVDIGDGTSRVYTVGEDTLAQHRPSFRPPLRRWAAERALRAGPARLGDLLGAAAELEPRHRDAMIHGLLDAAGVLGEAPRRRLARRGLRAAQAGVRRTALDLLCGLDGPEEALRRARSDSNAAVRAWCPSPRVAQAQGLLEL